MKKLIITLFLAIFIASTLSAQRVLTLEECINIALENNLSIKRAKNDAISAKAGYTQSKFNFLPSLSAGASHSWNEGLFLDNTTGNVFNTTTLGGGGSISASMTIFGGFRNIYNVSRNKYLYEASEEAIQNNIQLTEASIVSSFLQYITTKENLKIAQDRINLLNEQLEREEKRERAGVGNLDQVYNFKSQVAQQNLTIVNLENSLKSSKLTLLQLLLLDPNEDYDFQGVTLDDAELETEIEAYNDIYEKSLEFSPALRASELNLQASKKSFQIAQNAWMPSLTVGASYGTSWSSNRKNSEGAVIDLSTQFKNNRNKSASFSLNVPLFTRWNNRMQLQQSKIQVLNSELNMEQARNTLTNQVQQAYLELVNAKTSYAAAKESMVNLNTSFEFSKSRYENGTIDFVTYLQSLNAKNSGELQLVQAKYTILFRQLILDIYTGELNINGN